MKTGSFPAILMAMIAGFIAIMLFTFYVLDNGKEVQTERFHQLQEVLLENQVAIRDSIIQDARIKIDSLSSKLMLYNSETIWLARGIYSETNDPFEMYPVAWVIRNRYDQQYNGCDTYKCVILDPLQFSAFNWNSHSRAYYTRKSITDQDITWTTALNVAAEVISADTTYRPFSENTLYFYSPISMQPQYSIPRWVTSEVERVEIENINEDRFRFYKATPELLTKLNTK